jgi:hypothetical protein
VEIRRQVLDGFGRTLGPENPHALKAMWFLADLLHRAGEDAEASLAMAKTAFTLT